MEITKIYGRTYYVKGATNTGIYFFDDNKALIIDPGYRGLRPKKLIEKFKDENIDLKYIINTHEHNDHYGACNQFKEVYNNAKIVSSKEAKIYIENPEIFAKYIMGGKPNDFFHSILKDTCIEHIDIDIDIAVDYSNMKYSEIPVKIIFMPGHTSGSISVMTKDKVIFVGDTLVGEIILKKYDFLFLYDIEAYINSLEILKNIEFEYLVLGHGKEIISKKNSYSLIERHEQAIQKYLNQVRKLLIEPITLEKLLKHIIVNNNLSSNYKEYHFFKSSLVSLISYLAKLEEIEYIVHEGELLYYTKRK
ncbi:MAG: MBL fold metallo-hydrolase [Romboutsia sp.]